MVKSKKFISLFLTVLMIFTSFSPVYAESEEPPIDVPEETEKTEVAEAPSDDGDLTVTVEEPTEEPTEEPKESSPTVDEAKDIVEEFFYEDVEVEGEEENVDVEVEGTEGEEQTTEALPEDNEVNVADYEYLSNNEWIDPDYDAFNYARDAEIVAFIERMKKFDSHDTDEFSKFITDNLTNVMDLMYLISGGDRESIDMFDVDLDYNSMISAEDVLDAVNVSKDYVDGQLATDPENEDLLRRSSVLDNERMIIFFYFPDLDDSPFDVQAGEGSWWPANEDAYCTLRWTMERGGGTVSVRVSRWTGGSNTQENAGNGNYSCSSTSCMPQGGRMDAGGTLSPSYGEIVSLEKGKEKCNRCAACGRPKCHQFRYDHSGGAVRPNGTVSGLRIWDGSGHRVFCLDYNQHITDCSVYHTHGSYSVRVSEEQILHLAAAVGYYQASGYDDGVGDAVQTAIWALITNGTPIPDYMLAASNNYINHDISMSPKSFNTYAKSGTGSSTDSNGELGGPWSSKYTIDASSNLSYNRSGNTISFTNKDPYPVNKTLTINADPNEVKEGCSFASGSLIAWFGEYGTTQPFADSAQFEPEHCTIHVFHGDSFSVHQPAGNIEFQKVTERTNSAVSCPYVDAMGVSHACKTEFALYMETSGDTWNNYNGTSIDMGSGTRVTYDGKTYQRVKISMNGNGGDWKDSWSLDSNGKISITNVPAGNYFIKEMKTNTEIWDLNPKYYPVTVRDGQTSALTSGTNSDGASSGSNFPNQEFGALKIVKYTAEHQTTDNHTGTKSVPSQMLTANTYTDGYNNKFDYQAKFRLYIDETSPLWGSDYDYTAKVDPSSAIPADKAYGDAGVELHVLRVSQDANTANDTAQFEDDTNGNWTWEWVTQNGEIKINSIPVMKYSDGVNSVDVYVKEVWTNTNFMILDRNYHKVTVQKNANTFEANGTNRYNETNDLLPYFEIDKYIKSGIGADTITYARKHADDTYTDSYGDVYESKATFAVYIDKDSVLWGSEYDCSANAPSKTSKYVGDACEVIPADDNHPELHQLRVAKDRVYGNDLEGDDNIFTSGDVVYEYKWTTDHGHIDITQIPIRPRDYTDEDVKSGTYYFKEVDANEDIFELDDEYHKVQLAVNENGRIDIDNDVNPSLEIHKYDEDSMPDGTPRKVTADYCSQENIDEGTYCDLTTNKPLSDYFVLLIDENSPLWGLTREEAIKKNIGAYDAGPYFAYDEDWGNLGYISGITEAVDDTHESIIGNEGRTGQNSVNSGSVIYDMDFSENEADAKLHMVMITGYNKFEGANKDVYTTTTTETYEDGNVREFTAGIHWHPDEKGDVYIKYLPAGTYYLKEHSVDPSVFSLDEYLYEIEVKVDSMNKIRNLVAKELDPAAEWTFANTSVKTGGLEFVKLDEEGHNAGAGHVFEIYYVNSFVKDKKEAQANGNSQKNAAGQWGKDISNSYELARTVSAKKHYLAGYADGGKVIPEEDGVRIVKFQINYDEAYLQENPGHYKYRGTGPAVDQFVTDANGRIYIERLPIGTYIIKEVETSDESVFDLTLDNYGNEFQVEDDHGKVYENAYRFSIDQKLVTCLNGKENPDGTHGKACHMVHMFKNKNNSQVPSGLFADTETRTNTVKVGEHNADVETTFSFDSTLKDKVTFTGIVNEWRSERGSFDLTKFDEYGNTGGITNYANLHGSAAGNAPTTFNSIIHSALALAGRDAELEDKEIIHNRFGNEETIKGTYGDVGDKVFEFYYLDENDVLSSVEGRRWWTEGSYSVDELTDVYDIADDVAARLQSGTEKAKVLSLQVDDVDQIGTYVFKHWDSDTVDFDEGTYNDAVYQFITDATGKLTIDQLPIGQYLLVEVGTTNSFVLNIQGNNIPDIKDGETTEMDIVNYNRNVDLEIDKAAADYEKTKLDDAEYVVYDITDTFRSDYATEAMPVVPEGELLFVRADKKIDLYNLLIANTPIEEQVANRPVKYSMNNVDYASIDSDGFLSATATGKVTIQMLGGVYSLYGNLQPRRLYTGTSISLGNTTGGNLDRTTVMDVNEGEVVITEGKQLKLYKDAAHNEPVSILRVNVSIPDNYDINTPGTYNVEYEIVTTDHIVYHITRPITFVEKDAGSCMYYPEAGKWLKNGKVCQTKDPVYKESDEVNYDPEAVITLLSSTDAGDWNDTPLGERDVYILKDGKTTNAIIPVGSDATALDATKVFKAITGHITITVQDYKNHNYPVPGGELVIYSDPECQNVLGTFTADELGMVDLTDFAEEHPEVEKAYFESYINDDGYYLDRPEVVEIDMTPRRGYAQVKNLKHGRKYIVCETVTPNGYEFAHDENACTLIDTTSGSYGDDVRDGKRIIYRSAKTNILNTLDSSRVDVHDISFAPVANTNYAEGNFEEMIAARNDEYALWEPDTNEEHMETFVNDAEHTTGIFDKFGRRETSFDADGNIIDDKSEVLMNVVFDVYEYYGSDADDMASIMDGTEYNWAAKIIKAKKLGDPAYDDVVNYTGRFSTGMIYYEYLDAEGNPIANAPVEISQTHDFSTIYLETATDEHGVLATMGDVLGDGTWYYRLKRPLKEGYNPCQPNMDDPTHCDVTPSENDYVQYSDLAPEYAIIHDITVTRGRVNLDFMRAASTYIFTEVALYDNSGAEGVYIVPDDDVSFVVNPSYSGFNFNNSGLFTGTIWNDISRHKMGTKLTSEDGEKTKSLFKYEDDLSEVTLIDTVHMVGLKPGAEYEIRGCLGNKETHEIFVDMAGNEVCTIFPFTAETKEPGAPHDVTYVDMDVDVPFTFDLTDIEPGKLSLVALEELWTTTAVPRIVDEHKDWDDEGQTVDLKIYNPFKIEVRKVDDKGQLLENAVLSLIEKDSGEVIKQWTTVLESHVLDQVEDGLKRDTTYILREEEGPEGYYLVKDVEFTTDMEFFGEDNYEQVVVTDMVDYPVDIKVLKVDDSDQPLENAKIDLFELTPQIDEEGNEVVDEEGNVVYDEELIESWTTVLEEHDISKVVKPGHKYKLVESETPNGYYQFVDTIFDVELYGPVEPIVLKMVDEAAYIEFLKLDPVTGKPVINAKYAIYELAEGTTVADLTGKTVDELVEAGKIEIVTEFVTAKEPQSLDVNGKEIVKQLSTSKTYYLQEHQAPFGYLIDPEAYQFKVTGKKDSIQTLSVSDEPLPVYVKVAKGDKDNIKYFLKGAEITIFTEDGTIAKTRDGKDAVGITDENGEVKFILNFDQNTTYYAQETKAPKGYELNKDKFPIEVKVGYEFVETDMIKISILDQAIIIVPPKPINTGFGMTALIAAAVLVVAGGGLILVRKRKKEEE